MYIMSTNKWKLIFFLQNDYLFVLQLDFQYHRLFWLPDLFILVCPVELPNVTFVWHPLPWVPSTLSGVGVGLVFISDLSWDVVLSLTYVILWWEEYKWVVLTTKAAVLLQQSRANPGARLPPRSGSFRACLTLSNATPKSRREMSATLKSTLSADSLTFKRSWCTFQPKLIKFAGSSVFSSRHLCTAHLTSMCPLFAINASMFIFCLWCNSNLFRRSHHFQLWFLWHQTKPFFFCSHIHLILQVPFITLSGYSTFNVAFYCVRFTLCYSSQFSFYWHTNIDPFVKFYFCCTLFCGGFLIRHIILTLVCLLHSCISASLNDFMPHFCALSKLLKNCL